ncbi:hypothetical protein Tco_0594767 [Tanacetum coccineum]
MQEGREAQKKKEGKPITKGVKKNERRGDEADRVVKLPQNGNKAVEQVETKELQVETLRGTGRLCLVSKEARRKRTKARQTQNKRRKLRRLRASGERTEP